MRWAPAARSTTPGRTGETLIRSASTVTRPRPERRRKLPTSRQVISSTPGPPARISRVVRDGLDRGDADRGDVLTGQQHRIGERERVDDDEAGRNEHDPTAIESRERTREQDDDRRTDDQRADAGDDVAVGKQQRTARDAGAHRGDTDG